MPVVSHTPGLLWQVVPGATVLWWQSPLVHAHVWQAVAVPQSAGVVHIPPLLLLVLLVLLLVLLLVELAVLLVLVLLPPPPLLVELAVLLLVAAAAPVPTPSESRKQPLGAAASAPPKSAATAPVPSTARHPRPSGALDLPIREAMVLSSTDLKKPARARVSPISLPKGKPALRRRYPGSRKVARALVALGPDPFITMRMSSFHITVTYG